MGHYKYICVQPVSTYYAWQLEVMLTNFIEIGMDKSDIHVLMGYVSGQYNKHDIDNIVKLEKKFGINFHHYPDTRTSKYYVSSLRPNILKQHSKLYPHIFKNLIFYHDCDILFTKKVDWETMGIIKDTWYVSDTNNYLNYDYIISKGQDVYEILCQTIGIDPLIPKLLNSQSGGAQYIMKNTDYEYWDKVEKDSLLLLKAMKEFPPPEKGYPIQSFCAEMWATLWNMIAFGKELKIHPELNFTFATSHYKDLSKD